MNLGPAGQIGARYGSDATIHAADLRDGAALRGLAEACADVDVLVNNAGADARALRAHAGAPQRRNPPATRTERILTVMKAATKAKYGDESRGVVLNLGA
jgi:NADP-dependent 3-hydroxy acid dehydrogenase YdfG